MARRLPARPVEVSATVAGAITVAVVLAPGLHLAYRAYDGHLVLETAESLIALLLAYLVYGRFRISHGLDDLLLAYALGVLAVSDLILAAGPSLFGPPGGKVVVWQLLATRLTGALALLGAAFVRPRAIAPSRTLAAALTASCLVTVAVVTIAVNQLRHVLPAAATPGASPELSGHPHLFGPPLVLAVHALGAAVYFAAARGFLRRERRTGDELMAWFGAGAVVAGFARVHYVMFPETSQRWLYTGDVLRLAGYVLLLVGAAREIGNYWDRAAAVAVLEERRRLARDLHDGLAQELAFIATQAKRLSGFAGSDRLAAAAQRALDEARRAIAALTTSSDEPLDRLVAQAAEDVAARTGTAVRLDLAEGVRVAPATREALIRIVREAVVNATRHGQAAQVTISLSNGDGVRVRVVDDGVGFDPTPRAVGGFGLVSMRERAAALGGELRVRSTIGQGSEVEVWLP